MAFIDGNHTDVGIILNDFNVANKLVRDGGVILFDDYHPTKFAVKEVADKVLSENPSFKSELVCFHGLCEEALLHLFNGEFLGLEVQRDLISDLLHVAELDGGQLLGELLGLVLELDLRLVHGLGPDGAVDGVGGLVVHLLVQEVDEHELLLQLVLHRHQLVVLIAVPLDDPLLVLRLLNTQVPLLLFGKLLLESDRKYT